MCQLPYTKIAKIPTRQIKQILPNIRMGREE